MLAERTLGQLGRQHLDRRLLKHTGFFTFAATGAMLGMHRRQKQGVSPGARVGQHFQRNRLVDDRANPVADITAQAEKIQTGLVIDQRGKPHFRLVDIDQPMIERTGRTGFDARDVLTHLTRPGTGRKVRRTGSDLRFRFGEFENVVRAIAHA